MDKKASITFRHLTEISYDYGLITWKEYIERLKSLNDLSDEFDLANFLDRYSHFDFPNWENNENYNVDELEYELIKESQNQDEILQFKINTQGRKCAWEFHKADPDDKPSVPHGHGIQDGLLKLDVYRGYIFNVNKGLTTPCCRESKKYIKLIWNTQGFREFAREIIEYYITTVNKTYNWSGIRGIRNPRRLPRF